ncbi:cell wall-binding repeat-containing protein [Microbacterium lacus]|uniref:cell wall-binding repeat-containing protein n=1 Tax=Microbacterium lacus TaxID=415217 RepID=UPI00384C6856
MSKVFRALLSVLAAAVLTFSSGATAIAADGTGSIAGVVTVPPGGNLAVVLVTVQQESFAHVKGVRLNPDGTYRIDGIPAGSYVVAFSYQGVEPIVSEYAGDSYKRSTATRVPVSVGQETQLDAQLDAGAVITINVTDDRGPVPQARVDIGATGDTHDYQPVYQLFTQRSGEAHVTMPLPPGTYRLVARTSGSFPATQDVVVGETPGGPAVISVTPGSNESVEMSIVRMSTISGVATVEAAGGVRQPYVGYVVLVDPDDYYGGGLNWTDDGTFEFEGLRSGGYQIRFGGESNLVPETYWPGVRSQDDADLISVGETDHPDLGEITLVQGGMLGGNVYARNAAGSLVAAPAEVSLWKRDEVTGYYEQYLQNWNDSAGKFGGALVEAGTYAVRARPAVESGLGSEWHTDARYFADSTDVIVAPGQRVQFTDMVLEPRYFDIWRVAGADRFSTAVEITRTIYGDAVPAASRPSVLYLTNAFNYPDALAAGPAASAQGGAILPVAQDHAPEVILNEIARLRPLSVVVVGGVNAISPAVVAQVRARVGSDVQVSRIGEATRYETAEAVVRDAFRSGSPSAFIATGQNFPDALAAGAAAAHLGAPVILVPGGEELPAATAALLADLGTVEVFIAGGPFAISSGIEADLQKLLGAVNVTRLAGETRYQTASVINATVFNGAERALLASGSSFPDALSGGPLASALGAPLYLAPSHCVTDDVYFQLWDQDVQGVALLGGTAVLADSVAELGAC